MTDQQHETPESSTTPKRRGQRMLWIAGPLLVAIVAGYFYLHAGRYVGTENAYIGADQVTIAPQVAGRVTAVAVQENQKVKKGDLLFRIDQAALELAVDRLNAQMVAVGNYLAATKDSYQSAQASLKSAEASLRYDQAQLERVQGLRARGLVAQQKLDEAANDVATSVGERDAARAAVARAKTLLGGDVETPVRELSGYKAMQAQLAGAVLDLEHSVVRAPVDGIVGKYSLEPGDYLQIGEPAMPLIGSRLWVDANFKETDLTHVEVGDRATVVVDTYPDHEWQAHVVSISPATGGTFSLLPAQNATGNWVKIVQRIPVRLELERPDDADLRLRVGMSTEVSIDTGAGNSLWGRWFGGDRDERMAATSR